MVDHTKISGQHVLLAHGGGGVLTRELIERLIVPALDGDAAFLPDAACMPDAEGLVFTTDSFVVKPLFFQGGNIGSMSVYGTVNDLAVSGAEPLALSLSLIIEEGFDLATLQHIVHSAGQAARACGVSIITGDTKVVARKEADGLFITTAGIGKRRADVSSKHIRAGDRVLLSGPIGDHGVAVMSEREGIRFETQVQSDAASVWPLVRALLDEGVAVHAMRDPTRGGLAASCVELADEAHVSIALEERAIPVRPEVRAACEMLGLDPLTVANEGKLVAFVAEADASRALHALQRTLGGEYAAIIGTVTPRRPISVCLRTRFGVERVVEMPYGEELPRIC